MGFKAGDLINDHDTALGYLLTFHAHVLPSFREMSKADQRTIRFTQAKMAFNHGWLVQGEAPPGPLFSTFKSVPPPTFPLSTSALGTYPMVIRGAPSPLTSSRATWQVCDALGACCAV